MERQYALFTRSTPYRQIIVRPPHNKSSIVLIVERGGANTHNCSARFQVKFIIETKAKLERWNVWSFSDYPWEQGFEEVEQLVPCSFLDPFLSRVIYRFIFIWKSCSNLQILNFFLRSAALLFSALIPTTNFAQSIQSSDMIDWKQYEPLSRHYVYGCIGLVQVADGSFEKGYYWRIGLTPINHPHQITLLDSSQNMSQ